MSIQYSIQYSIQQKAPASEFQNNMTIGSLIQSYHYLNDISYIRKAKDLAFNSTETSIEFYIDLLSFYVLTKRSELLNLRKIPVLKPSSDPLVIGNLMVACLNLFNLFKFNIPNKVEHKKLLIDLYSTTLASIKIKNSKEKEPYKWFVVSIGCEAIKQLRAQSDYPLVKELFRYYNYKEFINKEFLQTNRTKLENTLYRFSLNPTFPLPVITKSNHLIDSMKLQTPSIISMFRKVPRGNFCDKEMAYEDRPCTIGFNQTISAPHIHAMTIETLKDKLVFQNSVLDVGSGSGFLLAIFGYMVGTDKKNGGTVVGIDIYPELVAKSIRSLKKENKDIFLFNRLQIIHGDGWKGVPGKLFDVINIGANAPTVPHSLWKQLKPGGLLLIPLNLGDTQVFTLFIKDNNNIQLATKKELLPVRFVPLIKK